MACSMQNIHATRHMPWTAAPATIFASPSTDCRMDLTLPVPSTSKNYPSMLCQGMDEGVLRMGSVLGDDRLDVE